MRGGKSNQGFLSCKGFFFLKEIRDFLSWRSFCVCVWGVALSGIFFIILNSDVCFLRSIARWKALSEGFPTCVLTLNLVTLVERYKGFIFTGREEKPLVTIEVLSARLPTLPFLLLIFTLLVQNLSGSARTHQAIWRVERRASTRQCDFQIFMDTIPSLVYRRHFECRVVAGIRAQVSTTRTWNSNH